MTRPRILVVDDEPGMLRAIERVLASSCDVHTARRPLQALEAAAAERFELALLDIRMPEMDGFELMSRLLELSDLDVILMTGSTDERDARLVRAIREKAFFFLTKPFDREVLITLVERCLDLRRLDHDNREHLKRLERELAAARVFQQSLLPPPAAARGGLDVAYEYQPCVELCGDFCDYGFADRDRCAMIVTDVAGHGAPAAMLTGMIKQIFRGGIAEDLGPGAILQRIVAASRLIQYDRHLTAICACVHPLSNRVEYVNAGHPPGFVARDGGAPLRLESTAPLIHPGLPGWHGEPRVVPMNAGDRLVLYTDGLIEARDAAGDTFGIERVVAALAREDARAGDAAGTIAGLRSALATFTAGRPLEDDLTLMVARRT
jgi:serine phosphatase RsbU (regulator of sigma subunit)